MKRYLILLSFFIALLASCGDKSLSGMLNTKDFSLAVMQLKQTGDLAGTTSFRVKILLPKEQSSQLPVHLNNKLLYQTDSSFYVVNASIKQPAALVQAVATGITGVYEYLIEFDDSDGIFDKPTQLLFYDKHITQRQYLIKLNN